MNHNLNVIAIVVTYNRKLLLKECLISILNQSYPVERLIIVDNCSTDGTDTMIRSDIQLKDDRISYIRTERNLGGAGGFARGLKIVEDSSQDWIWIMDDDTIPDPSALENLIRVIKENPLDKISFLASCVKGIDGEPMNVPVIDDRPTPNGYADWYFRLNKKMVKILTATFVSILISHNALNSVGLPCVEFFIWGDDTEYTTRLTRYYGSAYLVGDSDVCHKRVNAKKLELKSESDIGRISNYFYYYRNNIILTRFYSGITATLRLILKDIFYALKQIRTVHGILKFKIIISAIGSACINYNKFKNYINSQINLGKQ